MGRHVRKKIKDIRGQVREAYEDMFLRLAITAEYKDPGAGGHIRRVSDYSTAIARSLSMPSGEISVIRYASMMHDIGKIGISEKILGKKAALSDGELAEMKRHTVIGSRIFGGSRFPLVKASAQIALAHHEKYDGTGYPNALKGKKIPLYGRIVAVADCFDALVSERCYKSAVKFGDAMMEIARASGTCFDPHIIEAFLRIRDTIKKILDANIVIEDFSKTAPP